MDVILTGCGGRLGGAVWRKLVASGHRVFGVDLRPVRELAGAAGCASVVGELTDRGEVHRVYERAGAHFGRSMSEAGGVGGVADGVVHLAARINSHAGPAEVVLGENMAMNSLVFTSAVEYGVRRLVFSSSVQAFLGGMDLPKDVAEEDLPRPVRFPIDETHPARPSNTYGVSKLLTEQMLGRLCSRELGLMLGVPAERAVTGVSLRFPFLLNDGAFEWSMQGGWLGKEPNYRFSGPEVYTYLHVDDAAALIESALRVEGEKLGDGHEVVWACGPDPRVTLSVAEVVERFFADVPGARECVERGTLHDCSKAEGLLGFAVTRVLREAREAASRDEAGAGVG